MSGVNAAHAELQARKWGRILASDGGRPAARAWK
jgi:hypothetical protein